MAESNLSSGPLNINPSLPPVASGAKLVVVGVLLGLVLAGSAFCLYFYWQIRLGAKPSATKPSSPFEIPIEGEQPSSPSTKPSAPPATASKPKGSFTVNQAVWLEKGVPVEPLPILSKASYPDVGYGALDVDQAKFYHIANFVDGSKLYNLLIPMAGPGTYDALIRVAETEGKSYFYLERYLESYVKDELKRVLIAGVGSTNIELEGLEASEVVEASNVKYKKLSSTSLPFDSLKNPQKVGETSSGPLYQVVKEITDVDGIYAKEIVLRHKDNSLSYYKISLTFLFDEWVPQITWDDGSKDTSQFTQMIGTGCGGPSGSAFIKNNSPLIANKKRVGTTSNGELVFQVMDSSSSLVKELYRTYKIGRDSPDLPPKLAPISYEEFVNKRNHFLWKDPLGDWQIFVNGDYTAAVECAKPVVYLYPEKETEVIVKVGAKIRQSDPPYQPEGWQVTAKPDGQLILGGKVYSSLFWDGQGWGVYPSTKGRGFVVAGDEVVSTVRSHLAQLGLNDKEIGDFLEFWGPKLPTTPYVRLTWLMTEEMNELAPLWVRPQPETVIRVFLEFEGLKEPVSLKPQTLSAPPRQGFTLVEWGGLLVRQ